MKKSLTEELKDLTIQEALGSRWFGDALVIGQSMIKIHRQEQKEIGTRLLESYAQNPNVDEQYLGKLFLDIKKEHDSDILQAIEKGMEDIAHQALMRAIGNLSIEKYDTNT